MNASDVPKTVVNWIQGSEEEWEVATKLAEPSFAARALRKWRRVRALLLEVKNTLIYMINITH